MTFLAPFAFALLLLIPPIILLYLLKLQRQDYEVSSVYLWQRFVRDVEANAPWQRLRRNLLLFLQILFLVVLILALTRPALETLGVNAQSVVFVLDTSASMASLDMPGMLGQPRSRLDEAKNQIEELVVNLAERSPVTLITAAGSEANLLVSASTDRRQVLSALDAIEPLPLDSDLGPALALAEAIVARDAQAEIVLLSDGVVILPAQLPAIRFMPIGQATANQAITTLTVSRGSAEEATLFVQVSNYGPQSVARRLVIEIDDEPFTAFDLTLSSQGHQERIVENLPATARQVTASLAPVETDPFVLDDHAWTVVRGSTAAEVILVTEGNFFLQTALNLLDGQRLGTTIDLQLVGAADWTVAPTTATEANTLLIFDGFLPDTLPQTNLLLINPPTSAAGLFDHQGVVDTPRPEPTLNDHPLLQNVSLANAQILQASLLQPEAWARTVVAGSFATDGGDSVSMPLLLAGEEGGRRLAIIPFDLHQSDLPLQPAFPILIANLVNYLAPGAGGLLPTEVASGQSVTFSTPPGVEAVNLVWPDKQTDLIAVVAGRATLPPLTQLGLYQLLVEQPTGGASTTQVIQFAVNLFNPAESQIAPNPEPFTSATSLPESSTGVTGPAYEEWWRTLAIIALVLLVIEWLVYHRNRVWQMLTRWQRNKVTR